MRRQVSYSADGGRNKEYSTRDILKNKKKKKRKATRDSTLPDLDSLSSSLFFIFLLGARQVSSITDDSRRYGSQFPIGKFMNYRMLSAVTEKGDCGFLPRLALFAGVVSCARRP